MTWSELIALKHKHSPNADVYLSIHLPHMLCRMNFPVARVRSDGEVVFLEGMNEHAEGGGTA